MAWDSQTEVSDDTGVTVQHDAAFACSMNFCCSSAMLVPAMLTTLCIRKVVCIALSLYALNFASCLIFTRRSNKRQRQPTGQCMPTANVLSLNR